MTEEELKEEIAMVIWAERLNPYNETATKILTLIRESGLFMDVEMVKGLMFEAQAKKCMDELDIRQQMFRVAFKWYPSTHDLGRKWDMIDEMLEIPTIKKALQREWALTHYHDVDEFYKD